MAKKNKAAQTQAAPATPDVVTITFRPVHLETPIEIVQSFNMISSASQEYDENVNFHGQPAPVEEPVKGKKAKKEKKAKKAKCGVRKVQNFFFFLTFLALAGIVALYFMDKASLANGATYNETYLGYFLQAFETNALVELHNWTSAHYLNAIIPFVVLTFLLAIVVRWILHPLGCKVRKGKHCCAGCEFLRYVWTVIFVGIILAYLCAITGFFGFNLILESAIKVVNTVLAGGAINQTQALTIYALMASGAVLVVLLLITLIHHGLDKKRARKRAAEDDYNEDNLANLNSEYANPTVAKR